MWYLVEVDGVLVSWATGVHFGSWVPPGAMGSSSFRRGCLVGVEGAVLS